MKKDKTVKKIIRYRRKELSNRILKLSNLRWMIGILIWSIFFLILSYLVYNEANWLSGVFVSTACGGFTGLVLYFLSNTRNNKYAILQTELRTLKSTYDILNQIDGFKNYHRFYLKSWGDKRNIFDDGYKTIELLDELTHVIDDMPRDLYNIIASQTTSKFCYEDIMFLKSQFFNLEKGDEVQLWFVHISDNFSNVHEKIFDLIKEKEDQLSFLGHYFV